MPHFCTCTVHRLTSSVTIAEFTLAPASRSSWTQSLFPPDTAKCRGEATPCCSERILGSQPDTRRYWRTAGMEIWRHDCTYAVCVIHHVDVHIHALTHTRTHTHAHTHTRTHTHAHTHTHIHTHTHSLPNCKLKSIRVQLTPGSCVKYYLVRSCIHQKISGMRARKGRAKSTGHSSFAAATSAFALG